eukprot:TRINITY_DN3625_c0_g1_i4.p1 TRINITY_DN3625_c0_g1~~TRINITY_DN3625_c0_g1_i4.p1  ORF type:complete len:506 (-),score=75.06 TRINITY_DN3625_c0_g1_i4:166-1683(-)
MEQTDDITSDQMDPSNSLPQSTPSSEQTEIVTLELDESDNPILEEDPLASPRDLSTSVLDRANRYSVTLSQVFSPDHRKKVVSERESMRYFYSKKEKRKAALFEILTTERSYHESLYLLNLAYKACKKKHIICEQDINTVFSVLPTIYQVSSKLLEALERRFENVSPKTEEIDLKIGDIFLDFADYFKTYCNYCDNYFKSSEKCGNLLKHNQLFQKLCSEFKSHQRSNNLNLETCLIMPVQRIPRYLLLIKALLEYTPSDHHDYNDLSQVAEKLNSIAQHVDKSVKEAENRAYVIKFDGEIYRVGKYANYSVLAPHRKFIMNGVTQKRSLTDDSLQERNIFLFNDIVITTSLVGYLQLIDKIIPLESSWVFDKQDGIISNAFWLCSKEKTHCFVMHSRKSKREWMESINNAIADFITNNLPARQERDKYRVHITQDQIPLVVPVGENEQEIDKYIKHTKSTRLKFRGLVANSLEIMKGIVQPLSSIGSTQTTDTLQVDDFFVNIR